MYVSSFAQREPTIFSLTIFAISDIDILSPIITCYLTLLHVSTHLFVESPSHGSRDQPSAQELTKYMGQPSPAPALVSALAAFCKVLVVAMSFIATAVAIAERDGPCIAGPNHRQSSEDGGDGQDVHNLLPRKGLIDQF